MTYVAGMMVLCLAAVHIIAARLPMLDVIPRSRLLSIAGGVTVAYVFVHLLPELSERQEHLAEAGEGGLLTQIERHVYLLSMVGLLIFYGLERMALSSRHRRATGDEETTIDEQAGSRDMFWVHVGAFALYNALIGYLLVRREGAGWQSLTWFFIAMALHFLVNDHGLRQHYKHLYNRIGRWLLAVAVVLGYLVGISIEINKAAVAALFGLLSGAIVLNVLKEELPEARESRFWAFGAGAAGYAVLLLLI